MSDQDRQAQIGLIGPRGSGKTQFKVYWLCDNAPPPDYLVRLYRVTSRKDFEKKDEEQFISKPGLKPIPSDETGIHYQQKYAPTTGLKVIPFQYKDEVDFERKVGCKVSIYDFPGGYFTSSYDPGSTQRNAYLEALPDKEATLRQIENLVLIVPFWHLFPPNVVERLIEAQAIDPDENQKMRYDMEEWSRCLNRLAGDESRPHCMVIAISQFGGETLRQCEEALFHNNQSGASHLGDRDRRAVEKFRNLGQVTSALTTLEQPDRHRRRLESFYALRLLRSLRRTGWAFITACADGSNPSAADIKNFPPSWSPEVLTFNVVDGQPIEKPFK